MGKYQTSGQRSSGNQHSDERRPLPALPVGGAAPLVNRCISHPPYEKGNPVERLLVYPRAVKIVRPKSFCVPPVGGKKSSISSFSAASKKRLRFTASNSTPLISQFCATYHETIVSDGRLLKKHLNRFLTQIRKHYPTAEYLWILEFQRRGAPHFHIFLTLPRGTEGLHDFLARTWNHIAEPDSKKHLRFHLDKKNFIDWSMGSGSYLCKYLDKEHQKAVPLNFSDIGRFWGNSRGIVREPEPVEMADVSRFIGALETKQITRWLCNHHEKSLRNSRWKSSARKRHSCYTLPNGAAAFKSIMGHFVDRWEKANPVPF